MQYYAVGNKREKDKVTGEVSQVSKIIPLTETNRALAVKQAERIARRERLSLEFVRPVANKRSESGVLTKNLSKRDRKTK